MATMIPRSAAKIQMFVERNKYLSANMIHGSQEPFLLTEVD